MVGQSGHHQRWREPDLWAGRARRTHPGQADSAGPPPFTAGSRVSRLRSRIRNLHRPAGLRRAQARRALGRDHATRPCRAFHQHPVTPRLLAEKQLLNTHGSTNTLEEDTMTIDFVPERQQENRPHITVFGIRGAGSNTVNNMIEGELEGVEFVVANTDT